MYNLYDWLLKCGEVKPVKKFFVCISNYFILDLLASRCFFFANVNVDEYRDSTFVCSLIGIHMDRWTILNLHKCPHIAYYWLILLNIALSSNINLWIIFVVPCSIGHYYLNEECISCPKGTYQDTIGQISYNSCPEGLSTEGTNSISIDDCNGKPNILYCYVLLISTDLLKIRKQLWLCSISSLFS